MGLPELSVIKNTINSKLSCADVLVHMSDFKKIREVYFCTQVYIPTVVQTKSDRDEIFVYNC